MGSHFCFGETASEATVLVVTLSNGLWKTAGPLSRRLTNNVVDMCGLPVTYSSFLEKHSISGGEFFPPVNRVQWNYDSKCSDSPMKRRALQLSWINIDSLSETYIRTEVVKPWGHGDSFTQSFCLLQRAQTASGLALLQFGCPSFPLDLGAGPRPNNKAPFHASYPDLVSFTCKKKKF